MFSLCSIFTSMSVLVGFLPVQLHKSFLSISMFHLIPSWTSETCGQQQEIPGKYGTKRLALGLSLCFYVIFYLLVAF